MKRTDGVENGVDTRKVAADAFVAAAAPVAAAAAVAADAVAGGEAGVASSGASSAATKGSDAISMRRFFVCRFLASGQEKISWERLVEPRREAEAY